MRLLLSVATVAALATVSGCLAPSAPAPSAGPVAKRQAPRISLSGIAQAPANLMTNNGASIIGANGSNWRLLADSALAPVAHAPVEAVDENEAPIEGVASTVTDADGRFTLAGVPLGANVFVRVKQPGLSLTTLVWPEDGGRVEVTPASTLTAARLKSELKADPQALRHVPQARIEALEATFEAAIDAGDVAPALADPEQAAASAAEVAAKHPEVAEVGRAAATEAQAALSAAEHGAPAEAAAQPEASAAAGPPENRPTPGGPPEDKGRDKPAQAGGKK